MSNAAPAGASSGPFTSTVVTVHQTPNVICRANGGTLSPNAEADQMLGFSTTYPQDVHQGDTFNIKIKPDPILVPRTEATGNGIAPKATVYNIWGEVSGYQLPAGLTINTVTTGPIDGNVEANPDAGYYVNQSHIPSYTDPLDSNNTGAPPGFDPLTLPAIDRLPVPGVAPDAFWNTSTNRVYESMLGSNSAGSSPTNKEYAAGSAVQGPTVTVNVTATANIGSHLSVTLAGQVPGGTGANFLGSQPGNFAAPASNAINNSTPAVAPWNSTDGLRWVYTNPGTWTDPSFTLVASVNALLTVSAPAACGPGWEPNTDGGATPPSYYAGPNAIPNGTSPPISDTGVYPYVDSVTPADGATYVTGQPVNASYRCRASSVEDYDTCVGDVPAGTALDTSTPGSKSFTINGTDAFNGPLSKTVNYTVANVVAPVANAGAAQTGKVAGNVITLDGSASSDPNGIKALALTYTDATGLHPTGPNTFTWTQTSGPTVTLSDPHAVKPTFTAPPADNNAGDTYGFSLTVDNGYLTNSSTTSVAEIASTPTVTVAKARTGGTCSNFCTGDVVTLTANITNPDGTAPADYTYAWSQTGGRIAPLSSTTVANPTYSLPSSGAAPTTAACTSGGALTTPTAASANCPTYSVVVTRTNTAKSSAQANLAVYASTLPTRPVANAGTTFTRGPSKAASLNGTASTQANGHTISYAWTQTAGDPVTLSSSTVASPTFTTPVNPQTLTFSLIVTDTQSPIAGSGTNGNTSTASTVNVTVSADKVIADAGPDQTGKVAGNTVTLTAGASTDPNGLPLSYTWTQLSGPAVTLSNPNVVSPTFVVPAVDNPVGATFTFSVTATNGGPNPSDTDTDVTPVTITSVPSTPTVAAPTKARSGGTCTNFCTGDLVTLSVGITNPDGANAADYSYVWVQTGGRTTALSNTAAAHPTFIVPPSGVAPGNTAVCTSGTGAVSTTSANCPTYKVTVTKTNTGKASAQSATLAAYASTLPARPVANAGPDQTPTVSTTVTLAGSGTQTNGHPLSYAWTQTGGTTVSLSDPTVAQPTFTAPAAAGALTFSLVVTDTQSGIAGAGTNGNTSLADSATITVLASPPVADAGTDQAVRTTKPVQLHGVGTQSDSDALSYAWTQTAGTPVTLSDATAAEPTFTSPATADSLTFSLVVTDTVTGIASAPDTVTVTVSLRDAPVADAGADQAVRTTKPVQLHGAATQTDSDGLSYAWTQTAGTPVTLSDATAAEPTFTSPATADSLTFSLVATDTLTGIASAPDTVTVTVSLRDAPVADAGADQHVDAATDVTLHGVGTQTDSDALSYAWTQTAGTTVTLSDSTVAEPTFTSPPSAGVLSFSLVVTDTQSGIASTADSVDVTVSLPGRPVADAGADQQVNVTRPVTLHGVGTQVDDHTLTYAWTQTGGTTVTLSDPTAAAPTFTAPTTPGTLTFSLTVTDTDSDVPGNNTSFPDSVTVTVSLPTLSGTVTDAPSHPVSGAIVSAFSPTDTTTPTATVTTAADGTYVLSAAPGTYDIRVVGASGSDYLTQWFNGAAVRGSATHVVLPATNASGVNVQLVLGGSIGGTVTDAAGHAVAGVAVYGFVPTDGFSPTAATTSAADGSYVLHALKPSNYAVDFVPPASAGLTGQWYTAAASRAAASPLTISGSSVITSVNAHLAFAGSITGTVTQLGGTPLAGVTVSAFAPSDGFVASGIATTAANGTYTIKGLPIGSYAIHFVPTTASALAGQWFNVQATRAAANPVNVIAGPAPHADAVLHGASVISGKVVDAHGNPVAGFTVRGYASTDGVGPSLTAVTASNGTYSFTAIAPGTYKVLFQGTGYVTQWYHGASTRAAGTAINTVPGTPVTGVNATLVSSP